MNDHFQLYFRAMIGKLTNEESIPRSAALAEIPENMKHLPASVTIKPVIFRILLFEKTGRFENDDLP